VPRLTTASQRAEVDIYRERAAKMDLVTRKSLKEKTGVFTGAYAINPGTEQRIPIWIADYVLIDYGTGAIMAVPAHDERDFEFATVFALPIVQVVRPRTAGDEPLAAAYVADTDDDVLVNSRSFTGLAAPEGKRAITAWLEEKGLGCGRVNYRLHDWCISRQRYWGPP